MTASSNQNSAALASTNFAAVMQPGIGGLVSRLQWRNGGASVDLLHDASGPQDPSTTRARYGLWPMVPFANRAFGARLVTGERTYNLPVNDAAQGSAIHGFGWQNAWEVAHQTPDACSLVHHHHGEVYHYRATMDVALTPMAARFSLAVDNESARPLPHGIGFHPWFPRTSRTTLKFRAPRELLLGPDMRATGVIGTRPAHDFSTARTLPEDQDLVISAIDWDGTAEISLPEHGLTIHLTASRTLRHPVVWAPKGSDFLCFEPQSHAIGAPSEPLAQAITPMRMLEMGETLQGWMALAVTRA